ncbi:CAP domain-containing protein [Alysiella filiformis]|uniref:Uncharacterized conserved protein YkwD, contains CAP (CSP/antigen 5/PR1) domain n=1 Tax=Alysiella filiformis DSM 16848 TaxID=1120981 RepID=A0A286EH40_9NEIS|nr:CAP domain-containing protein [Alysiella filiformis]QMT32342.1 CAP domain-containing protein [Alysiella filiformis]UBQ56738.1 CAP domain-containing protein [Alysiella filiformis DSM 16848]SOD70227.1 Uncharacterized conserved protein YkwD, contains CAP (CSP/antigen 5/PR1) domain [Alysiella filiformis DSM 16848]
MRNGKIFLMMSVLLLAACAKPVQSTQHRTTWQMDTPQHMLNLINQARSQARKCGNQHFAAAPPLAWSVKLERAATLHAQDMAKHNYYSHIGRDQSTFAQRIQAQGYQYSGIAENIYAHPMTAELAMEGWLKSEGHCRNLMNPQFTHVGMGMGYNPNSDWQTYWVQNFAHPLRFE